MTSLDVDFLTLRNVTAYNPDGTPIPAGTIQIISSNGQVTYGNTLSTLTVSSITVEDHTVSSITTDTISVTSTINTGFSGITFNAGAGAGPSASYVLSTVGSNLYFNGHELNTGGSIGAYWKPAGSAIINTNINDAVSTSNNLIVGTNLSTLGNADITGYLSTHNKLTVTTGGILVNSGGANITGGAFITDLLTANNNFSTLGNADITGYLSIHNTLNVASGGATVNGLLTANNGANINGQFQVINDSEVKPFKSNTTGNYIYVGAGDSGNNIRFGAFKDGNTNLCLQTDTGGTHAGGNVGIGTLNPQALLHVAGNMSTVGNSAISGDLYLNNNISITNNLVGGQSNSINFYKSNNLLSTSNNNELGYIYFNGTTSTNTSSKAALIYALQDGNAGNDFVPGRLEFHTNDTNNSFPPLRMLINSQGNVGIGTPLPTHTLEVNGSFQITNNGEVDIFKNTSNGNYIYIGGELTNSVRLGAWNGVSNSARNLSMFVNNSGNQVSGNLGIGTANPQALLHVAGNVSTVGNQTITGYLSTNTINMTSGALTGVNTINGQPVNVSSSSPFMATPITFTSTNQQIQINSPGIYMITNTFSGSCILLTSFTFESNNLGSTYVFLLSAATTQNIFVDVNLSGNTTYGIPQPLSATTGIAKWNLLYYGASNGNNNDVVYFFY